MRLRVLLCVLCTAPLLSAGSVPADDGRDALDHKIPGELYESYEALNTPANLGMQFVGGKPPKFIEDQVHILIAMGSRNTPDSRRILLKVVDEYLKRVEKLGAAGFRTSPLQALQLQMVAVLTAKVDESGFRTRLETIVKSPVIKEYARGRAVVALVGQDLKAVKVAQDPDGSKRGKIVLDGVVGDMTFEECTHAPARLHGVARLAWEIGRHKPILVWETLSQADTLPKRYARDLAFASACSMVVNSKEPLTVADKIRLVDICERWLEEYRPLLTKQSFPSDVLGKALRFLAKQEGNEELARLMPPEDPKPVKPSPPQR